MTEKLQLELHRARIGLVNCKKLLKDIRKKGMIDDFTLQVALEASRVSNDFEDALELHYLISTLGAENEKNN